MGLISRVSSRTYRNSVSYLFSCQKYKKMSMEAVPGSQPLIKKVKKNAPTSSQLLNDPVYRLGEYYWQDGAKHKGKWNKDLVENIYNKDLMSSKFSIRRCMVLEFSRYLENYLWPFY